MNGGARPLVASPHVSRRAESKCVWHADETGSAGRAKAALRRAAPLLLDDRGERPKRLVHRLGVGKHRRHVRIQQGELIVTKPTGKMLPILPSAGLSWEF